MSRIVDVQASPIHRHQWLLTFACGHRVSVTSKTKPHADRYVCGDCWYAQHGAVDLSASKESRA